MSWINLTEEAGLNEKAYKEIPVGKILVFDFEGSKTYIKVMRKNNGRMWGKEVTVYRPEDISIVPRKGAKNIL